MPIFLKAQRGGFAQIRASNAAQGIHDLLVVLAMT
jgi:hypothetical protein